MSKNEFLTSGQLKEDRLKDRAVNFQRTVVNLLSKVPQDDFQLIFATSMLAPELNVPEFTIGEEYTVLNKSLKNV